MTSLVQRIAYAADGKIATISNADAVATYAYAMAGRDAGSTLALANGSTFVRTLTRDPCRRDLVTAVDNSIGADFAYSYDAASQLIRRNDDTFAYNSRSEVISESLNPNPQSLIPVANGYAYDNIGNLTFAAICGVTNAYTANAVNEYVGLVEDGTAVATAYDAEGNLTTYGDWTYTYDAENRLTTVSSNGLLVATNSYDYKGRRVRMVTQGASYTFVYDGWNVVLELVERNGTTDLIEYFWGKDLSGTLKGAGGVGGLLYLKRNGTIYVPIYDGFGNVVEYRAADGSLVAAYSYDAFGRTIASSGSLADLFRYRHATKCYETETGLYYYGYRHYVPSQSRWLTQDPIEEDGGLNLYGFCSNSALTRFDALGKSWSFGSCVWNCSQQFVVSWFMALQNLQAYIPVLKQGVELKAYEGVTKWTTAESRSIDLLWRYVKEVAKVDRSVVKLYPLVRGLRADARIVTSLLQLSGLFVAGTVVYCESECCSMKSNYLRFTH